MAHLKITRGRRTNVNPTPPSPQIDPWVTCDGQFPLASEEVNCQLVTVTEEDMENVVKHVPKIETLVGQVL